LLKDAWERIEELDNLNGKQKEDIERLQSMNQAKLDTIHDLMAEVERLKPFENKVVTSVLENIKQLEYEKFEAIKEFWEKLQDSDKYGCYDWHIKDTVYTDEEIESFINELLHQPTKIVHNSLCETETYESR
jgi:hypothetical protein